MTDPTPPTLAKLNTNPTDYDEVSSTTGSSIITRHRANLNRINSETEMQPHRVPEPSRATLRWTVPNTPRSNATRTATILEDGEVVDNENHDAGMNDNDLLSGGEQWVGQVTRSLFSDCRSKSSKEWLTTLLPMTAWLSTYKWRSYLQHDILAGLTVGVMIIPQSMSYAKLAGLPVQFGLYSSLMPIYAYALFGSSRQLAVGPVAIVSLLLATGLTNLLENEGITPESVSEDEYQAIYTTLALQTSILVGFVYIAMVVLRLGFVTIFLSHAVVSGFTSGAAIIIGLSQLKYFFGYSILNVKTIHGLLINLFANIEEFNWKTFVLGVSCTGALVGLKKVAVKYPSYKWAKAVGPLLVTVICIMLQATVDLEAGGIPVVGYIPPGLPSFTGGIVFPISKTGHLANVVLSITIVGFMESIAIAKKLAQVHGYELDSSLELAGLGMANVASGLFGGYPITGSFSRSAVNNDSGAHSGLSGIVTATMVAVVLLCLTQVFELLALATLAAIVISAVVSLVDYSEAVYLWRVHKFDFSVWIIAFIATLFLGVEMGLALSVGISLLLVIFESAYPHTAVLGRLPGTHHYRNIKQYPNAELYDGIVLIRVDAPIYFANTQHVSDKIQKYYQRAEKMLHEEHHSQINNGTDHENEPLQNEVQCVQFIVLELTPVSHIDTSAIHTLLDMKTTLLEGKGIQLCLSNPNPMVMQRLVQSGLADEIGRDHIFVSLHDAVHYCLGQMDAVEISKHLPQMYLTKLEKQHSSIEVDTGKDNEISDVEIGLNL